MCSISCIWHRRYKMGKLKAWLDQKIGIGEIATVCILCSIIDFTFGVLLFFVSAIFLIRIGDRQMNKLFTILG